MRFQWLLTENVVARQLGVRCGGRGPRKGRTYDVATVAEKEEEGKEREEGSRGRREPQGFLIILGEVAWVSRGVRLSVILSFLQTQSTCVSVRCVSGEVR